MELFIDCLNKCRNYIRWMPGDKIQFIFNPDSYIIHEDQIRRIRFSRKTAVFDFKNDEYRIEMKSDETFRLFRSETKRYLFGWIAFKKAYQLITEKPMKEISIESVEKTKFPANDISYDPIELMPEDNEIGVVRVGYLTYT